MRVRHLVSTCIPEHAGFNPRTREGATGCSSRQPIPTHSFNPRTREGATRFPTALFAPRVVSIHAPVRVRRKLKRLSKSAKRFNPRTREGATLPACRIPAWLPVSIHAPVRVRRALIMGTDHVPGFNPRTREGATPDVSGRHLPQRVSIHAPVRVRLQLFGIFILTPLVSIHAPVRVRPISGCRETASRRFNPRTREGATYVPFGQTLHRNVSIHAPVRVRLHDIDVSGFIEMFQSTHP